TASQSAGAHRNLYTLDTTAHISPERPSQGDIWRDLWWHRPSKRHLCQRRHPHPRRIGNPPRSIDHVRPHISRGEQAQVLHHPHGFGPRRRKLRPARGRGQLPRKTATGRSPMTPPSSFSPFGAENSTYTSASHGGPPAPCSVSRAYLKDEGAFLSHRSCPFCCFAGSPLAAMPTVYAVDANNDPVVTQLCGIVTCCLALVQIGVMIRIAFGRQAFEAGHTGRVVRFEEKTWLAQTNK
ncbi:hypothetical protein CORC01_11680, partial [Colletotrichum orchidophilum]